MSHVIKTIIHMRICVYTLRRQAVALYRLVGKYIYIYIYIYIYVCVYMYVCILSKNRAELQVHTGSDSEESSLLGCGRMYRYSNLCTGLEKS